MKFGARNSLTGVITSIKRGDVMCQIGLEIEGGAKMGSVITTDSAEDLNLQVGDNVRVIVKAVNVLVAKE